MKRTIRLTETELHGLIKECLSQIIYERKLSSLDNYKSLLLTKLALKHGGLDKARKHWNGDLANSLATRITDKDIVGIKTTDGSRQQFNGINPDERESMGYVFCQDGSKIFIKGIRSLCYGVRKPFTLNDKTLDINYYKNDLYPSQMEP